MTRVEVTAMETTKEDWVPLCGFAGEAFSEGEFSLSAGGGGMTDGGTAVLRSPPSKNPTTLTSALFKTTGDSDQLTLGPLDHSPRDVNHMSSARATISKHWCVTEKSMHLISVRESEPIAARASAWVDMTMKPRRREALSMVARMTACETLPYMENISTNSLLVKP